MRLFEISKRIPLALAVMSDQEKHALLEFINAWLSGRYMVKTDRKTETNLLEKWREIAAMFPPKLLTNTFFRLVTVPLEWAVPGKVITFNPAPNNVSSWTLKLVGLDNVAGVADETKVTSANMASTARIGISTTISHDLLLATPATIRDAVMAISGDYFDRYPVERRVSNGIRVWDERAGYPADSSISMDDVEYLHDTLNRPGGNYRQYECVIETPATLNAKVVRIYRVGEKTIRDGNYAPNDR